MTKGRPAPKIDKIEDNKSEAPMTKKGIPNNSSYGKNRRFGIPVFAFKRGFSAFSNNGTSARAKTAEKTATKRLSNKYSQETSFFFAPIAKRIAASFRCSKNVE